jgi:hypothetical protein
MLVLNLVKFEVLTTIMYIWWNMDVSILLKKSFLAGTETRVQGDMFSGKSLIDKILDLLVRKLAERGRDLKELWLLSCQRLLLIGRDYGIYYNNPDYHYT